METIVDLRWAVERALAIRSATGWTAAERERSWVHWEKHAREALAAHKPRTEQGD